MKEFFKGHKFRADSITKIDNANEIVDEYSNEGYELTLRQLYYQFVARGLISNNQQEYKKLGSIINKARLAGLIDWDAIADRTRHLRSHPHWSNPSAVLRSAAYSYAKNKWANQEAYVEVWVEKDALIDIVQQVCDRWDVPCFSCRGYVSQSSMYEAGKRHQEMNKKDRECHVIHLGDHDPSGMDMSRDIEDRLYMFEADVELHRIALNMDQVDDLKPPPNPAKITDSRAGTYIAKHGYESWELDALEPKYLDTIIESKILEFLDVELFEQIKFEEDKDKDKIHTIANNWEE